MLLIPIEYPLKDLPPGPTWQCKVCGALVRTGEPHSARLPKPHRTLEALFGEGE